jgi:predicted nucleic acid-binding protein
VLDDFSARLCAVAHEVRVIGTLGIVLRAKKRGQVKSARPPVKRLVAAGMFMGDEFAEGALASIGEMRP